MKLLHISKPQRKSNSGDWEQSTEPFPSQLPPGFDTEASTARGTEPVWFILTLSQLFCVLVVAATAPGISSSIHKHHTCTACCNPSAEKAGASRQTYSSTSHQSSPRTRSSHYTSGQHKPRIWGYCSRKPGAMGGCGASHLQGHTERTCLTPPGTDMA